MSAGVIKVSSSSGSSEEDEKKKKRKLSNRESARRSRERKLRHKMDLINEKASLESDITDIKQKVVNKELAHSVIEVENKLLSYEKAKLEEQLRCFKSIIDNNRGQPASFDHVGFSEPQMMLNPVQLQESFNYQLSDVAASSGSMFINPSPCSFATSSGSMSMNPCQFPESFNYQLPDVATSSGSMFLKPWRFEESFNNQLPVDAASSESMLQNPWQFESLNCQLPIDGASFGSMFPFLGFS